MKTENSSEVPPPTTLSTISTIPRLRLDLKGGKLYRGDIELPSLSGDLADRLLEFLYKHKGEVCTKDEIGLEVYDATQNKNSGVSDAAIARLINRARQRVEIDPANPVYVITLKSRGYRLDNTE